MTSIWRKYDDLRRMSQKDRLAEARLLCESPTDLATMFTEGVKHSESYDNRSEHFYPLTRARRVAASAIRRTNDVVLRLEEQKRLVPVDADDRRIHHDAGASVVAVEASRLACDYVDRELLVQRTTSRAQRDFKWNIRGLRLDVLLTDATDRTPVVGEVKLPGDMDPFFALFQALACAAYLATTSQYERMRRHLGESHFPELTSRPLIDVWVLSADSSDRQQSRKGRYMGDLERAGDTLAPRLLAQDAIQTSLRRIVAVDLKLNRGTGTFDPVVRWAWERRGNRPAA